MLSIHQVSLQTLFLLWNLIVQVFLVVFVQGRIMFKDLESWEILIRCSANRMYLLDLLMDIHNPQAMIAMPINQPVDLDKWHCHFRHVRANSIWTLVKRNLVDGLSVKGNLEVRGLCKDYIYEKHTLKPYNGKHKIKNKPKDYVYVNL